MQQEIPGRSPFLLVRRILAWLMTIGMTAMAAAQTNTPATPRPELFVAAGDNAHAAMAPSPDGKWFVTQSNDGRYSIWDAAQGTPLRHFEAFAPNEVVFPGRLAVSADSRFILIARGPFDDYEVEDGRLIHSGSPTRLELWDVHKAQRSAVLEQKRQINAIAAGPTRMVVAMREPGFCLVRSIPDGKILFKKKFVNGEYEDTSSYSQVHFSADGSLLSCSSEYHFSIWDWQHNRKLLDEDALAFHTPSRPAANNPAKQEEPYKLSGTIFSPEGSYLAVCAGDEVHVYKVVPGERPLLATPRLFALPKGSGARRCFFVTDSLLLLPGERLLEEKPAKGLQNTQDQTIRLNVESWKSDIMDDHWHQVMNAIIVPHSSRVLTDQFDQQQLVDVKASGGVYEVGSSADRPEHLGFTENNAELHWDLQRWSLQTGTLGKARPDLESLSHPKNPIDSKLVADYDASNEAYRIYKATDRRVHGSIFGDLVDGVDPGKVLYTVPAKQETDAVAIDPTGRFFAIAWPVGVDIYELKAGKQVTHIPYDVGEEPQPQQPSFSPDGAWLIQQETGRVQFTSTENWTQHHWLPEGIFSCTALSRDSTRVAYADKNDKLTVAEFPKGRVLFSGPEMAGCPIAFTQDGSRIAVGTDDGAEIFDIGSQKKLVSLYLFPQKDAPYDWLVATPDGLFDGTPGAWTKLRWRFNGDTFNLAPLEIFFREFYHPGLLAEVMSGKSPQATTDIANIDRRQPQVQFVETSSETVVPENHVHLHLAVTESRSTAEDVPGGSGARDLRLFRNGTLARIWRGPLPLNAAGQATVDADVPISAGENRFTAYVFNHDNIKSTDATLTVQGDKALEHKGTAYVLAIGINHYAEAARRGRQIDLGYAVADATDFAENFAGSQRRMDQFAEVRVVYLFDGDATRNNVLAALDVLGGASRAALSASQQKLLAPLGAVRPEDGVFLFYAGHGVASGKHFFLLPTDFNPEESLTSSSSAISEETLGERLEAISPAHSFLVIDACQSGQILDMAGGAVGPMNSSGLAQLAYEKGLYILAASQSREAALEAAQLAGGHGYLTFALVEDGLKKGNAAGDGILYLRPWFEYASQRVPQLQAELSSGIEGRGIQIEDSEPDHARQHPRVFYRREEELIPLAIAEPNHPKPAQ